MEGMEGIVASVSGYHGSERFKLIKLISLSGASYVGALSRSTTHLVCWKFEGEKYQLAKKFGIKIVNHLWFEDCVKKGKRISEQSYTRLSGQQVGSITLDLPAMSKEVKGSTGNKLVLDGAHKSHTDPVIDIEYEITEHHDWDDGLLLNKTEDSSKRCSKSSRKQKKRVHDASTDTIVTDPPRTSRRLVKMSAKRNPTDCLSNEIINVDENAASTSHRFGLTNENAARISERSKDASASQTCAGNQGLSEIEVTEVLETISEDLIPQREERAAAEERTLQNTNPCAENVNEELRNADPVEQSARSPTSLNLSCVICWTQFSSTRGVLPCGHRFCFSCIQNWADCMVSKGKTSTCPLCKSDFTIITRVDADSADQKIFSQSIPCAASTQDIVILPDGLPSLNHMQVSSEPACCRCNAREPEEDSLTQCVGCHIRHIHYYCVDPPRFPWKCDSCRDLSMFHPRI